MGEVCSEILDSKTLITKHVKSVKIRCLTI